MNKGYIRFSWITLVLIFLVIIAGSVVRTTGSGMGCPDWPKCFDQVVPPTSEEELPENYKEIYGNYRKAKVKKFASFLQSIGMSETAEELLSDPELVKEEDFNAARTWTEYGNRLVGFLAGNFVLILFIWTLFRYRDKRQLLWLTFLNLVLMAIEGWLGSIVVATNLVPWTITVHMFLALVIVGIQIKIIRIAENKHFEIGIKPIFKYLFFLSLALVFVQIILGSQVRQEVDFLVKDGIERANWISSMEGKFLLHRSFSWLLLLVFLSMMWLNKKWAYGIPTIKYMAAIVLVEFITGILFSYAGMPALLQPVHLLMAAILLGIQFYSLRYFKNSRQSVLG